MTYLVADWTKDPLRSRLEQASGGNQEIKDWIMYVGHRHSLIAAGAPGAEKLCEGALQQLVHEFGMTREDAVKTLLRKGYWATE